MSPGMEFEEAMMARAEVQARMRREKTIVTLRRTFRFEAAHWLPMVAEGHKCHRMHGHSYAVEIHVSGPVREDGMVVDFAEIKAAWGALHLDLDHHCLNDLIENPTSENLARWIWERMSTLPLSRVVVSETTDSACIYEGPA